MKAYKKYKDSGVEWIGEIPEHWRAVSLKWISNIYSGGTPDKNKSEYWENGTIPWLNSGAVNDFIIKQPSNYITENGFKNSSTKIIKKGSVVVALAGQGKTKGMSALVTFETAGNQSLAVVEPDEMLDSRFLLYYLTMSYKYLRAQAGDNKRDGLNLTIIGNFPMFIVSKAEQIKISEYLDYKTHLIDKLISNNERLIKLLEEKKEATINQAVTKGLDPSVKMKDSGVEWIGEIPEHWKVVRMKYLANIDTGAKNTEDSVDDGKYPFIVRSQSVERINSYSFDGEAILTAGDGVGVCKVFHYMNGKFDFHQRVYKLSNFKNVLGKFLFHYIRINFTKEVKKLSAKSTVDSLRRPMFQNFPISYPNIDEQRTIVQYIEHYGSFIDKAVTKAKQQNKLLKEYRQALISNAVTGKIDIRNEKVPAKITIN